jgi:SAM-dependent methyltransferase
MSSENFTANSGNSPACGAAASSTEIEYIEAMSRESVVQAYAKWKTITKAESTCIDVAFRPNARVLDLGSGAGRFAALLAERSGSYLGVDASPQMIAAARRRCPGQSFIISDIVEFSAEEASYDLVLLMGNVLDYLNPVERRASVLASCANWLSPGGRIVGSSHLTKRGEGLGHYPEDYHGAPVENFRASFAEIVEEVESHGFEMVLAARDYRDGTAADWAYWVAELPSRVETAE